LLSEIQRKDWDKIAGGILIVTGIVTAIVGGSLLWYEEWRHAIGEKRGRR